MRDRELQAKVSRLRQIIAEAVPVEPPKHAEEADAWRRYQAFAANDPLPAWDDSERARQVRAINRIATSYGWISEIQRLLDALGASSLSALSDEEISQAHERMVTLEDCAREGFDPPDCPVAR